jgi:hypothetical protein
MSLPPRPPTAETTSVQTCRRAGFFSREKRSRFSLRTRCAKLEYGAVGGKRRTPPVSVDSVALPQNHTEPLNQYRFNLWFKLTLRIQRFQRYFQRFFKRFQRFQRRESTFSTFSTLRVNVFNVFFNETRPLTAETVSLQRFHSESSMLCALSTPDVDAHSWKR